ncbi:peptidylprolyl isomerase [Caulobacter sp. KR2-114]|uniref:peptidylprolyl isomerase n=1 Tax=Caulobacter sp. KR2-114 TaxID=3400912 RepID=UPI003C03872A
MSRTSRRAVIAGAGALAASHALAQSASGPAPAAAPPAAAALPRVTLSTGQGDIVIELASDKAPVTCANFLRYVDAHRLNNASFYRAMKVLPQPLTGLVQGGIKNDPKRSYPPIAHESTTQTGLSNRDGAVSMARYAPGTAASEFFICVGDVSSLDADPKQPGDNQGFAVFGHVVAGMEVVKAILLSPVSATKGADSGMVGQILDPEVAITTVRRS